MSAYRALTALLAVVAVLAVSPVDAGDDAGRARAALQAGEVVPLDSVLAAVRREFAGEIIEIELDHDDGRWIYKVKLLGAQGAVAKLEYDAKTVALVKARAFDLDSLRRR